MFALSAQGFVVCASLRHRIRRRGRLGGGSRLLASHVPQLRAKVSREGRSAGEARRGHSCATRLKCAGGLYRCGCRGHAPTSPLIEVIATHRQSVPRRPTFPMRSHMLSSIPMLSLCKDLTWVGDRFRGQSQLLHCYSRRLQGLDKDCNARLTTKQTSTGPGVKSSVSVPEVSTSYSSSIRTVNSERG